MGIFARLFHQFNHKPHKALLGEYSRLHNLSSLLAGVLQNLRLMHKELLVQRVQGSSSAGRTGDLAFKKTVFVEEDLIPKLKILAKNAEERFGSVVGEIHHTTPLSPLEKAEIDKVIHFLEKIQQKIPRDGIFSSKMAVSEKLILIENILRDITLLSKDFYEEEKEVADLARKIGMREISPLLRKMYEKPETKKVAAGGAILVFTVTMKELRQIEKESERINAARDPDFFVSWQRWWRATQIPEADKRTPLKDPHINLTVKLFGKPKKDIHLLLAA